MDEEEPLINIDAGDDKVNRREGCKNEQDGAVGLGLIQSFR